MNDIRQQTLDEVMELKEPLLEWMIEESNKGHRPLLSELFDKTFDLVQKLKKN